MAPGFKPVGWVAAVAGAAIGCYMLSLNVASERADLLKIERQIIATKQDIRTLQTELGTRGRLAQLEVWNSEVLALSAPTTGQFLDNEVKLARFDRPAPTIADRVEVQMASAEAPQPQRIDAPVVQASAPAVPASAPRAALVHRASLTLPGPKVLAADKPAPEAAAVSPAKPSTSVAPKPETAAAKPVKPVATPSAKPAKPPVKPVVAAKAEPESKVAAQSTKSAKPVVLAAATPKPAKPSASRLDPSLARELGAAAKRESSRSTR